MIGETKTSLPEFYKSLAELGCLKETEIYTTQDGFSAAAVPLAEMLAHRGITAVPGSSGDLLECGLFFDDWYLYAVAGETGHTYGLFKMREQEYDAKLGRKADGDTPGVTVSFIALREEILLDCLRAPTLQRGARLNREIDRVVARSGERHTEALKRYFIRTEAQGAYLIAKLYTAYIAGRAQEGFVAVPECYAAERNKRGTGGRLPRFLEENNRAAGRTVCDHEKIYIGDPLCPTEQERLAILATHTGNTSVYSFAAEVQFHAKFLTRWANIPLIRKSPYASAIRADMSIGDAEFVGPTPYYRAGSRIVQAQYLSHKDREIK